jgi:hypothetical protein
MNQKNAGSVRTAILIISVLVGLAAAGYFYLSKSDYFINISDNGIEIKKGFASSNEQEAVALLKKYVEAQKIFFKHKGFYAKSPAELVLTINGQLTIIDADLMTLESTVDRNAAWSIYSYIPVEKQGAGFINRKTGFLLCAAPNGYKDGSAIHTLCVGPTGTILMKDTGGRAVTNASEIDSTWERI